MTNVFCHIAISLDGYAAGPNQSKDNPLGEGGMRLHEWTVKTASWGERHALEGGGRDSSSAVIEEVVENVGAYIMGRNMFDHGRGDWDLDWRGWWGEDPPFHTPVYVLTPPPRVPPAGLRRGPPPGGAARDAGRHDVPLHHGRPRGGARAGPRGGRRPRR